MLIIDSSSGSREKDPELVWFQVNPQHTHIAIVLREQSGSGASHVQYQLWDVRHGVLAWTKCWGNLRDRQDLKKPAFNPNGNHACFPVLPGIFMIVPTKDSLNDLKKVDVMRYYYGDLSALTSSFALGGQNAERLAIGELQSTYKRNARHLGHDHFQSRTFQGMTIDVVSVYSSDSVLCYDSTGEYLFHMYTQKSRPPSLWISVTSVITGKHVVQHGVRDFVIALHSAIPIEPITRKDPALALRVTYEMPQTIRGQKVGGPRHREEFMIVHLGENLYSTSTPKDPISGIMQWVSTFKVRSCSRQQELFSWIYSLVN